MTNEQGLVLFYLGDLRVRAHGLCLSLDLKLVYVQELFLSFAEGSFYAKMAAENGARILAMVDGAPLAKPISVVKARKLVVLDGPPREWAVRLAIFADPTVKR